MQGLKLIHAGNRPPPPPPPRIEFDYLFRVKVKILIIQVTTQNIFWDFWQIICNILANPMLGGKQASENVKNICVATAAFSVNCIHRVAVFSTNCQHRLAHV